MPIETLLGEVTLGPQFKATHCLACCGVQGGHQETMNGRPARWDPDFSGRPMGWGPRLLRLASGVETPISQASQWGRDPDFSGTPEGWGSRFLRPASGMGTPISQARQWDEDPDFSGQPVRWGPRFLRPASGMGFPTSQAHPWVRTPVPQAGQWPVCHLSMN